MYSRGDEPYKGLNANEVMDFVNEGGRLPKPELCPDTVYDVMNECWHFTQTMRPNFNKLKKFFENDVSIYSSNSNSRQNVCCEMIMNWSCFGMNGVA